VLSIVFCDFLPFCDFAVESHVPGRIGKRGVIMCVLLTETPGQIRQERPTCCSVKKLCS